MNNAQENQTLELQNIPLDQIQPNPWNRKVFDPEKLQELAASMKANGIVEPLIVRKVEAGYEICSGHRRWLAAQMAGLITAPCLVREATDDVVQDTNLVANIQREDIGALEKARMLKARMEVGHLTPEQIGEQIGKSRTWVMDLLAFLNLPEDAQSHLTEARVSVNAARAIASLPNEMYKKQVAREVKQGKLKPENIEHRVRQLQTGFKVSMSHRKKKLPVDAEPAVEESPAPEPTEAILTAPTLTEATDPVKPAAVEEPKVSDLASQGAWKLATTVKDELADHYVGNTTFMRLEVRKWLDRVWETRSFVKLAIWAVAAGILLFGIYPAAKMLTWWIQ